jgi:hypothetical protein
MAGLYEALVDELTTDRRETHRVAKIICSTATIRRFKDQIRALYGRQGVALFPPPGLAVGDSYFSHHDTDADGAPTLGRTYVGVLAPALGSLQTAQVRSIAALLQGPMQLSDAERDPWWTLLIFFNSLRELGGTLSLIQSDIPDYLRVLKGRLGISWEEVRKLNQVLELTSRLQSSDIPDAIGRLESPVTSKNGAVDICLASSMIEVGIDIDRLSLMAIIGQPKTTAQYIQVTGRVGRRWWERPGLVVTVYSASKPRDRSHFEKFRSYHERLYAQVEPTSVTPFSRPVLERALHAIMAGYARQYGDQDLLRSPRPYPAQLMDELRDLLTQRSHEVDQSATQTLVEIMARREAEWRAWNPAFWDQRDQYEAPLLRMAGSYEEPVRARRSWPTPTSLRNVDLECQAEITTLYSPVPGGQE